jgi:SIT family siderophore-iron:H+ symporter-like MFS transporter
MEDPELSRSHDHSDDSSLETGKQKPLMLRKVEIYTRQYGVIGKIVLYVSIFLVAYAYGLDNNTRYVYQATATNSYSSHSLLATVNVVRSVIAAAGQPLFARLSDVFGRTELFIVSIVFYVVGTIIESQAYDVQKFAGGAVLYQLGLTGAMLILEVIIMDNSLMNWRLLASFVPALPFIINTWISGNVTAAVGPEWSWGIAMWAIIFPVVSIPLVVCMYHMQWRAKKSGDLDHLKHEVSDRQRLGTLKFLGDTFWKLDPVGIVLIIAFLTLILVPFTIAGGITEKWKHASVIAPIVVGFVCIPLFILWERYATYPIVPFHLLKDRSVIGALLIGVFINWIWYMQGDYMYTVLVVAVNQSVSSATRITSLYSFVSVITGTLFGVTLIKVRRPKPFIIFGTLLWAVSMGMLIRFRGSSSDKAGIIGALCLMGFGAGFFTYTVQVVIQSRARHEHMAVLTALYLASYNVGSAFGSSVSGAIWTQLLPKELSKRLSDQSLVDLAYGSPFYFVVDYPWGTPEREAVVAAYQRVQMILCAVGTALCVILIAAALVLHNPHLESAQAMSGAEKEPAGTSNAPREKSWKDRLLFI